jgi:hypothetical protein
VHSYERTHVRCYRGLERRAATARPTSEGETGHSIERSHLRCYKLLEWLGGVCTRPRCARSFGRVADCKAFARGQGDTAEYNSALHSDSPGKPVAA